MEKTKFIELKKVFKRLPVLKVVRGTENRRMSRLSWA
jgi:hypothetical protein